MRSMKFYENWLVPRLLDLAMRIERSTDTAIR
jgi:hypothetical protein